MLRNHPTCFKRSRSRLLLIIILISFLFYFYYTTLFHPSKTIIFPSVPLLFSKNVLSSPLSLPSEERRKIIYAFPFNQEFEILEAIFNETAHLIEKYIILESNYSAFGEQKPRRLYERLKVISRGQHRILILMTK
jgi:hypothetical protein